jgi:hypothetical protein
MKLFKYNQFIKESNEDIHSICKEYGIRNYAINEDLSIDVDGDVHWTYLRLTKIPLKFRNVSGGFYCHNNNLTNLEGSPKEVGGVFSCEKNQLTSLLGSPKSVGGSFYCKNNKLTSLEGSPRSVGGSFDCYDNGLTSLEGITQMSRGNTSIYCGNNNLRDVKGIKEGWRGYFSIIINPVYEIFKLFPKERFDEVVEYLNEYDVIRDGDKVILQALEMVFVEMCLDIPEIEYIKGYEII